MKKRFAVIGYGGQGAWHCEQMANSDVADCAGVYDISPARNAAAAAKGLRVYGGAEEIFGDTAVDAVVIATPNDSHSELTRTALAAGKHVICEKPAEMSAAGFSAMGDAAKKSGKLLTVHQNRRWDVDFLAVKKVFASGELGEPIRLESRIHGSRGIPSDWRREKARGGGMLLDWGVHLIDQALCLFPEKIRRVYCVCSHITSSEVDDGFRLELDFESGKSALVEVGTYNFLPLPRFYGQFSSGTLLLPDWREKARLARMTAWNEKDVLPVQTAAGITKTMAPRDETTLHLYEIDRPESDVHDFYRNFCAAMNGGEAPIVTPEQVSRVLSVIDAAFLSDERGQALRVEL